jgi:hypothetical protein
MRFGRGLARRGGGVLEGFAYGGGTEERFPLVPNPPMELAV